MLLALLAGVLITSVAVQPVSAQAGSRSGPNRERLVPAPQPEPPTSVGSFQSIVRDSRPGGDAGPPGLVDPSGPSAGITADCFVDFEDELVLTYTILDSAYNTVMETPWYQSCFDQSIYPAIAVKPMIHGHLHLYYSDPHIGPCEWDIEDWGRKATPSPSFEAPGYAEWMLAPCVAEIDPVTEARNGIRAHVPGEVVQVYAYDDDQHLPFALKTLQVVEGEVEVCHLPPGPHKTIGGGGSPWQCFELGVGYWGLEALVDNAIEVRIEYLTYGEINYIGIDLI